MIDILYIGSEIYSDEILVSQIERAISGLGKEKRSVSYRENSDPDLPLHLYRLCRDGGEYILCTGRESMPLVSRILATACDDTISTSGLVIHPSSASRVDERSYLYTIGKSRFAIILVESGKRVPIPPLPAEERRNFQIFFQDDDGYHRISRELSGCNCKMESHSPIPGWGYFSFEKECSCIRKILESHGDRTIETDDIYESLIQYLSVRKRTVTFAESCTGGLIVSRLTSRAGASDILLGSFVTYSNDIKSGWLGVSHETLSRHGAVSARCVEEMATGALRASGSDIAIAVSGIAGPGGATQDKPVGTVYISLMDERGTVTRRLQLEGDRIAIQELTVLYAFKMLIERENEIFRFFSNFYRKTLDM